MEFLIHQSEVQHRIKAYADTYSEFDCEYKGGDMTIVLHTHMGLYRFEIIQRINEEEKGPILAMVEGFKKKLLAPILQGKLSS